MRQLTVISMISLDGVIQSPGGPEEDTSGGFQHGGWVAPYSDEVSNGVMGKLMRPSDLLLGRITFGIWENYWPQHADIWPGINDVTKYVASTTRKESAWNACVFLNGITAVKELKAGHGSDIQVWGSGNLIQSLWRNDLVDELWLIIYPVTLGKGKKLFDDGPVPAAFKLMETTVSPSGLIFAHYQRAGEVKTGYAGA